VKYEMRDKLSRQNLKKEIYSMGKKKLVTLLGGVCLVLVLAALPFVAACASPVEEECVTDADCPEGYICVDGVCVLEEEEVKVLKVAQLQPLSGFGAGYGTMDKIAYTLAVEDINAAGGIKVGDEYYQLEIVEYDTVCDPVIAATLATKAIYDDGVKYIGMLGCGTEGQAILPIVEQENVVLFVLTDDSSYIGTEHPNAFYIFQYSPACAEIQYEYISTEYPDLTRVVGTFPDTSAGQALADVWEEVVTDFGFEIVDTIFIPSDTTEFYPVLTPLLGQDVDIIEQAGFPGETSGKMIVQARELGYEGIFTEFTGGEVETRTISAGGLEALEGFICTGYPILPVTAFGETFSERCEAVQAGTAIWVGYFYDSMWLLKLAIEKAGSIEPAEVMLALEEVTFSGVMGEDVRFAGEEVVGLNRLFASLYVVTRIENGEPVTVYSAMPLWAR